MEKERPSGRTGKLLVPVKGLSGKLYPAGTRVALSGGGGTVDAYVKGDWLPLCWWEFAHLD